MTESEYLRAQTMTRLRDAQLILGKILPGYGVNEKELREILAKLDALEERIRAKIKQKPVRHSSAIADEGSD